MEAVIVPLALRGRLGDEGTVALEMLLSETGETWRDDVLTLAEERFERRLAQEMSTVRTEISAVRLELTNGLSGIRSDLAAARIELLRWSFLFWIGQIPTIAGLLAWKGHP